MYDVDFDHQFIETEKYDAKPTYKKFLGYRPGVAVIGDLIVGIIRNFYKAIIQRLDVKKFGLNATSRIKALSSGLSLYQPSGSGHQGSMC